MKVLLRCLKDFRALWRLWSPLLLMTALFPIIILTLPLLEKRLVDDVLLAQRVDLLSQTIVLYGALSLLGAAGQIAIAALQASVNEQMKRHLRLRLFAHLGVLSLAFSHREHSGRTVSLFNNDVPSVAGLFSATFVSGLASVVGVAIGAVIMFSLSWQLAVVAVLAPPLVGGLAMIVTRPLRPASRRAQEKAAQLNEELQENLAGIREIIAFGRERSQAHHFASTLGELLRLSMRVTFIDAALRTGQSALSLVITLVILGFGGYLVLQGETTLGTMVAMRTLVNQTFTPAGQFFGMIGQVQKALGAADRVYGFFDQVPLVHEQSTARAPSDVAGEVEFDHVSFAYDERRMVLDQVSFVARPGEMIALVGPSGAGKSTLASLVARFYDPTEGKILLDGTDLRDLTLSGLREHIGFVFQDTFLFATTIRENIALGRESADEFEIIEAARAANAWEFIERQSDGLDTMVGERGAWLSQGQRQRLAIARALLRDPRILILDEPTSALDSRSEYLLRSALDNLMCGRTTFVIAHRLATVQRADRILVLDVGRIVEQGTHAELVQGMGLYRELLDLQVGTANPPMSGTPRPTIAAHIR